MLTITHRGGTALAAALLVLACVPAPIPPPPPPPGPDQVAAWTASCQAVWLEELGRPIDPSGLAGCLDQLEHGRTVDQVRAVVQASPEWTEYHARVRLTVTVTVDGRPVAGAAVQLDEGLLGKTDASGRAEGLVAKGTHVLAIEAAGYQPYLVTVAVSEATDHGAALVPVLPRLEVVGRTFRAGGRLFVWRYATGFSLLHDVAVADLGRVEAFLAWAHEAGFDGVRVLAMASGLFRLPPADGLRYLDELLNRAAAHGLRVEIVALADTAAYAMTGAQLTHQVDAVAGICGLHTNCTVEVANEPAHPTQGAALHDLGFIATLVKRVTGVPVAAGANCCGQPDESAEAGDPEGFPPELATGTYITVHVDRARAKWDRTRHVRELENLSRAYGKPVVSDEPIGADEVTSGSRSNDPAEFAGQGVLGRVFSLGATFHFQAGLSASLPGPVQARCAAAFIMASTLWPDEVAVTFQNSGWSTSPVKDADWTAVVRAYSAVASGGRAWIALVGLAGNPRLELQAGWTLGGPIATWSGLEVRTAAKGGRP